MILSIKPATRQGVKPLIGLYGESGTGKTYTGLLLARGIVGPKGRIAVIDTESGRGSLYADVLPGGYSVLELSEPFAPSRYIEAIQICEQEADICMIDSVSHEWEGIGGVLDMAGENEAKSGKAGLHNWKQPKMEHSRFMLKLLQTKLPVICCLRAKHKSRQIKGTQELAESGAIRRDQIGKTIILKDENASPIGSEDFIFEMTAHMEILPDHSINLTKCSHPSLRECFPVNGPVTVKHGEAIARWCQSPGQSQSPLGDAFTALKKRLWFITAPVHGGDKGKLNEWLAFIEILPAGKSLETLTEADLVAIMPVVEKSLPKE